MKTNPEARWRRGRTAARRRPLSPARGQGVPPDQAREPWDDEQAQLARDLAVLIDTGLIAAVSDGHEIRYAVADGEDVIA